jgi:hypothetical protein
MGKVKASQITHLVIEPIIKTRSLMAVMRWIARRKHQSLDEH